MEQTANINVDAGGRWVNPVAVVFHHVEENRDLYRIILKGEGSSKAASRIRDIIEEAAVEFFTRHLSGFVSAQPELPKGLAAGYYASAMLGFVTWWLEKELPLGGDKAADLFMMYFFQRGDQGAQPDNRDLAEINRMS